MRRRAADLPAAGPRRLLAGRQPLPDGAGDRPRQRHNAALVDLFEPGHARKVLAEFGRAFSRLPEDLGQLSSSQQAFLQRAVEGLTCGEKVSPARLALLAEMIKGKPWNLATLRNAGGAEGVGVAFLDETFSARSANPQCRLHAPARGGARGPAAGHGERTEGEDPLLPRTARPLRLWAEAPRIQRADPHSRQRNEIDHPVRSGGCLAGGCAAARQHPLLPADPRLPRARPPPMADEEAEVDPRGALRAALGQPRSDVERHRRTAAVAFALGVGVDPPADPFVALDGCPAEDDARPPAATPWPPASSRWSSWGFCSAGWS